MTQALRDNPGTDGSDPPSAERREELMNDKFLYSRKYGNEPLDMKLLFIYFIRNIRYVLYSIIVGCVVFSLGYYLMNFQLTK